MLKASFSLSPKNIFKRKNGKKESRKQVSGRRMRSAISPEGRGSGSGTVMRMQHTAGTILAALLTRLELKMYI